MSIRALRKLVVFGLLALAFGGCGGDDDNAPATSTEANAPPTAETTAPTDTEPNPATETLPNDGDGNGLGTAEPETQTGGAGDEVPAATLALFTGKDGKITPRVVRVPAFISVLVQLRSADGAEYSLSFGGKVIRVSPGLSSAGTRFDGLKPGAKLVGIPTGASGRVVVSATAEPGP